MFTEEREQVVTLDRKQRTVLTDILRYNLEDREDALDDEEKEWLDERLTMAEEEGKLPVEKGDDEEYQRFAREFALEVQLRVDGEALQEVGEFYEEAMTEVVEAVRRNGGHSTNHF